MNNLKPAVVIGNIIKVYDKGMLTGTYIATEQGLKEYQELDKVYVVVREDRTDNGYESTNERVLSTREKAVEYIESEGYTYRGGFIDRFELSGSPLNAERYYRIDPWQVF